MVTVAIAVLIAPAVAILEYRSSADLPFVWEDRVWLWWGGRVILEIVIALVAVAAVDAAVKDPDWAPAAVQGVVIGASVPAIARSYFVAIDRPEGAQKIGVAHFYDLVVDYIEKEIREIENVAESSWSQTEAYASLVHLGWNANTLAFRVADVAEKRLKKAEFAAFKEKLVETIREPVTGEQKLMAMIAHARRVKAHRMLRRIIKKDEPPPPTGLLNE